MRNNGTPFLRYLAFLLLILVYIFTPIQLALIWHMGRIPYVESGKHHYLFFMLFLIALLLLPVFFPMRRARTRHLSSL